jgi:hypothetical protein
MHQNVPSVSQRTAALTAAPTKLNQAASATTRRAKSTHVMEFGPMLSGSSHVDRTLGQRFSDLAPEIPRPTDYQDRETQQGAP